MKLVTALIALISAASAVQLPSYLKKCKKTDEKCLINNINEGVKTLSSGDANFKLASIKPIKLGRINIMVTPELKVDMNNVKLVGYDQFVATEASFTNNKFKISGILPALQLLCQYDIAGKIMFVPIQGVGDMNITFVHSKHKFEADVKTVERGGNKFYQLENAKMRIDPDPVLFDLKNLFNGDKALGDEMNKFLNEGYKEVYEEIRDAVQKTMAHIFHSYISAYFSVIKVDDLVE